MKKDFLLSLAILILPMVGYSQNHNNLPQNSEIASNLMFLSPIQLYEMGELHYNKNDYDSALIYYNQFINTSIKQNDFEIQQKIVDIINKSAAIYYNLSDYRTAYDLLLQALVLCEKIGYESYKLKIYTNIGNIYTRFKKHDMAKSYYSKALNLCTDSTIMVALLTNMGALVEEDSALYYLNKSLQISKRNNNVFLQNILNNMARVYQKEKEYDSAYYYYKLALIESRKNYDSLDEARILSNIGILFWKLQNKDSALFYINLSNNIATDKNILETLMENNLTLYEIEESKGNIKKAFDYYKKYANLKDSVLNTGTMNDINQLQHLYEISKTNKQIEQLTIEQQIKEQTIHYQKIIWFITLTVLLLVCGGLLYIYLQKRELSKAYKILFEKNIEILDYQKNSSEKYGRSSLKRELQDELMHKILTLMEDSVVICHTDFTLDRLAELVQSNPTYVSQVINDEAKKNFRSFLNSYRIPEAQRYFSEPDAAKFSIESVAFKVGFKSRNAFDNAFKEITGVTPSFYFKSIQEQSS